MSGANATQSQGDQKIQALTIHWISPFLVFLRMRFGAPGARIELTRHAERGLLASSTGAGSLAKTKHLGIYQTRPFSFGSHRFKPQKAS
jgi:hypothetical protein